MSLSHEIHCLKSVLQYILNVFLPGQQYYRHLDNVVILRSNIQYLSNKVANFFKTVLSKTIGYYLKIRLQTYPTL